jgi:hypothetical protein
VIQVLSVSKHKLCRFGRVGPVIRLLKRMARYSGPLGEGE